MIRSGKGSDEHIFSIIIPVLHEADTINSLIEHIAQQQSGQSYEIIVVDGEPNGETINAISHPNVITAISEKGRAKQMNAGADLARAEVLVFLHADTQLPANALSKITHLLEDKKYVGGAFDLEVDTGNFFIKAIAARTRLRSRMTRVPYGDQTIFLRKEYFEKIGRFKDIPFMEDVELMQRIKKRGDRIFVLRDRVTTSARRWQSEGILYTTLRNMVVVTLFRLGVSADRLARYYKSGYNRAK